MKSDGSQTHRERGKSMENQILQLDPKKVLVEDNIRFGLKQYRVDRLADDIMEAAGVQVPTEVEPLAPGTSNGFTHRLTAGFYRHAAVSKLNGQGAGLTLPAIVKEMTRGVERLRHQVRENVEREDMSPMDQAIAIKKLLDSGVAKVDVRRIFARPGGRKGMTMQPASNSYVNMVLSFLDLPKAVQEKIHDGRLGVAAAYELTKVTPDKRAAILASAEDARTKLLDREEREETRILDTEDRDRKKKEREEKQIADAKKLSEDLEVSRKATEEAVAKAKAAVAKEADLYKKKTAGIKGSTAAETVKLKKEAEESFKAAQADTKSAQKLEHDARRKLDSLEIMASVKEKAKKTAKAKPDAVAKGATSGDIKKAAKEAGESTGLVRLKGAEIWQLVEWLSKQSGDCPKVQAIGIALLDTLNSKITNNQLFKKLAEITGERKPEKM